MICSKKADCFKKNWWAGSWCLLCFSHQGRYCVRVLYLAADKYEIPHLQDLCRNQLSGSMNTINVFDVLDLAKIHHDNILEHEVSKFIASHMEGVSSSSKFMSFVESDPALTVQAIRGHVNKLKRKRQEKRNKKVRMLNCERATEIRIASGLI